MAHWKIEEALNRGDLEWAAYLQGREASGEDLDETYGSGHYVRHFDGDDELEDELEDELDDDSDVDDFDDGEDEDDEEYDDQMAGDP